MYKQGQVVFDDSINEPVIFLGGNHDEFYLACVAVEEICYSESKIIKPLWDRDGKVVMGKFIHKNYEDCKYDLTKKEHAKFAEYLKEIKEQIDIDGDDENKKYVLRDG